MKLKFKGIPVEINGTKVITSDETAKLVLQPIIEAASGGPEDGHPQLNAIADVFGADAITDVDFGSEDDLLIY